MVTCGRRGIAEIVSILFAIIAIIALVIALIYILNTFREITHSVQSAYELSQRVAREVAYPYMITCSQSYMLIKFRLGDTLWHHVVNVSCSQQIGQAYESIVRCTLSKNINNTLTVNITRSQDVVSKVRTYILTDVGIVREITLHTEPIQVYVSSSPSLVLSDTFWGSLTELVIVKTVLYNNNSAWTCIGGIIEYYCTGTCTINGTSSLTVSIPSFCIAPDSVHYIVHVLNISCTPPCTVYERVTYFSTCVNIYATSTPVIYIFR